jgi:hypothetical protein
LAVPEYSGYMCNLLPPHGLRGAAVRGEGA